MPCKHEGGRDQCVRNKYSVCRAYVRQWYEKNLARERKKRRKYYQENKGRIRRRNEGTFKNAKGLGLLATPADAGEAGELLVAVDLLTRGLRVTKPFNRNGDDDLHVKIGDKWLNVQVKLAQINTKTGTIGTPDRRLIRSEIIAAVDLLGKRIRYISTNNGEVPKELA